MIEDLNFCELTKKEYDLNLSYYTEEEIYLYHFIIFKYADKYIKVDNLNDLDSINEEGLICKYYIEKIHFYDDVRNEDFEFGDAYHIYNVGYYYIGGFVKSRLISKDVINKTFSDYIANYKNMTFLFTDSEFLKLNKSKILFWLSR